MAPTTFPPGVWTADRSRSRLAYSAGPDRGSFDAYDASLVVDGEFAGIVAQVHGAHFATTALRRDGDFVEVDGAVTISGRTLAVTGCGGVAEDGDTLVLALQAVVDRRQFGVDRPAAHEVAIDVRLTFVKEPA